MKIYSTLKVLPRRPEAGIPLSVPVRRSDIGVQCFAGVDVFLSITQHAPCGSVSLRGCIANYGLYGAIFVKLRNGNFGGQFAGIRPAGSVAGIPVSVAGADIGCRSEIDQCGSLNNFVKSARVHGHSFTRVKRLRT